MSPARVSVVIPAVDEARWIEDCLRSVFTQDYPHRLIEVIVVVDPASSDATEAAVGAAFVRA